MGLSCGQTQIQQASIDQIYSISPFTVITGSAGSGKSIMMRHLFLDTIRDSTKVPIFLELRELNHTDKTLVEFIQDTLQLNQFGLGVDYIQRALKAGHFTLFFDGFDEVATSIRKTIRLQLHQLAKTYDKNVIVVSSRPDQEFSGWSSFSVLQISALTLPQACELVEKLPFDSEMKEKFLKDLRAVLFEKHSSFLSNPLLLSIMLLTYGMSADIPSKVSVFYSQAYDALFERHDALKSGFQRSRSSDLDIQDFARVFSAFSIQSYDDRKFTLSHSEALEYLDKSKKILGIDFKSTDYLGDALQAVCLLVDDGLLISYSHRSFQEYFVARFTSDAKPTVQERLISKYSKSLGRDNMLSLLYEMRPELVERVLIIPAVEEIERVIGVKKSVGITHYTRYLKNVMSRVRVSDGHVIDFYSGKRSNFVDILEFTFQHCGHLVTCILDFASGIYYYEACPINWLN